MSNDFPLARLVWDGHSFSLPPECGKPLPHQMQGTVRDAITELSGRTCYDSLGVEKSRSSESYHQHIDEVKHGSVREHVTFTFEATELAHGYKASLYASCLINRPGVLLRVVATEVEEKYRVRITANVRSLVEWGKWRHFVEIPLIRKEASHLGRCLQELARPLAPWAMASIPQEPLKYPDAFKLVEPETDDEIRCVFYLEGISRGLTHELVRHRQTCGFSQRSTRYVQESESRWIPHPLMLDTPDLLEDMEEVRKFASEKYERCATSLQAKLKERGVDPATARKQARGAARGLLGNALETAMIFSASLAEMKWIFHLRAAEPADGEIRVLAVMMFRECQLRWPDRFVGWSVEKASDGLTEIVVHPRDLYD